MFWASFVINLPILFFFLKTLPTVKAKQNEEKVLGQNITTRFTTLQDTDFCPVTNPEGKILSSSQENTDTYF